VKNQKNGRIVLNGPSAEGLHAFDNGRVDFLSGDIVSSLSATGNGAIHWRGGRLNQDEFVTVADNATVHFYGTNLRFETHPEFGDRVLGDLVNEPSFAVRYRLFDQGQIILHEVPEPTTLTLLAISTAGIWCARKRRLLR